MQQLYATTTTDFGFAAILGQKMSVGGLKVEVAMNSNVASAGCELSTEVPSGICVYQAETI
ncbi:MAG: hypothetical protein FWG47_07995, partial [Propionibacteriaceae bacterium]|nr:hypothetical protein [Propionibacteriaceae bacterium]